MYFSCKLGCSVLFAGVDAQVLGGGLDIVTIGHSTYIRSVPGEFNMDKNKVMEVAQAKGYVSKGV